ncbi:FTR1 family protein [Aeropyrum pernix]|uniref:FTR1 family protein n=1 Tax=Aeropyrum pernix TaxID=56636 RepID=A0A401HA44_AERPX|nr:FTR1 family protein [Aeropyrum pernix]GBF09228.1 FTR1 family protein [Aeropyrum pernix]
MSEALATGLVAFREAFEAILLSTIIIMLLKKMGEHGKVKIVYTTAILSVVLGVALGAGIYAIFKGFPEKELVEAGMSYLAALVIGTVIVWGVRHGPKIKGEIEAKLASSLSAKAVAVVTFIFVFREVLETVLITAPFLVSNPSSTILGVSAGTLGALALGVAVYWLGMRINLRTFFLGTSILLAFVASGLVGYGTHELLEWFEEEGIELGVLGKKIQFLNVGEDSLLHPKNAIGGLLSVMVGYYHYMEIARIILQGSTLLLLLAYIIAAYKPFGKL